MIIHDRLCDKRALFLQSHILSNDVERRATQKKILTVLRANVDVHCISVNDFN